MIKNEEQLKVTQDKIKTLQESLVVKLGSKNSNMINAAQMQTRALIKTLTMEVSEYNKSKLIK